MIGFAWVAQGFGFKVPKGYLYAAIGFSVAIESLNQIARRNLLSRDTQRPMPQRTSEGILPMLRIRPTTTDDPPSDSTPSPYHTPFLSQVRLLFHSFFFPFYFCFFSFL